MTFADLMAQLRAAVAEFGGDMPIAKLPLDRDTADPNVDQSSYQSTAPNPVVGHDGPALLIRLGPDGTMKLEAVSKGDTDVFRRSQRAMYAKRNKRWRTEGTDEGRSTDQLVGNPNEALDTETDIDDSD